MRASYLRNIRRCFGCAAACSLLLGAAAYADADWELYKSRFVTAEGAVVDTYNHNMSHSESQGYGLMFALANEDRPTFEKILEWTLSHLKNPDNGLFYWSYRPEEADPTADKNNASDGDLFIAWTLLKAGQHWEERRYVRQANLLAEAILRASTCSFAGSFILLPGGTGFYNNTQVVVNPSYLIFPALEEFARQTHLSTWQRLNDDSHALLTRIQDMNVMIKIAPDWVELGAAGQMIPAPQWPARSSYDAIRVPVYLFWANPQDANLQPWRDWFSRFADNSNPAWVNVATGETAGYMMTGGLAAVRSLVLTGTPGPTATLQPDDDYYNASLKMLVRLASGHF